MPCGDQQCATLRGACVPHEQLLYADFDNCQPQPSAARFSLCPLPPFRRRIRSSRPITGRLLCFGVALFESLIQVPANRIGYSSLSLGQLKVLQEVITLSVFVPFSLFYMQQPLKLD
jgi:hypothetical protein